MTSFPVNPKDREIFAAPNGKNYVYQGEKNVWQSTDCVPKWSDQVFIRGVENQTQQNVNDTNQEVNAKVGNVATATNQLLDVAFDVRCRGVWIYQGGAVAPGDPPVGLQRFLMTDAEGVKTQEYSKAVSLTVHAMGAGQMDKISIGETEVGDLITIQNTRDLGGGSYIVTAIEEFGSDNPDDLTDTYAVYTVEPDTKRCSGSIATEEKAVLRIIPQQAVPAFEDEYLPLKGGTVTGQLNVEGSFQVNGPVTGDLAMNGHKITALGDPTADAQAANRRYVDTRLKRTGGTSQKMEGILYLGGYKIAGVGDPELSTDAANKRFVEAQIAAIPEASSGFTPCIFTCQAEQNIGTLEPGKFFINDSGSIVLHHAMADGTLWCIKREGRNFVQEVPGIVTISELGGRTMFQGTISKLTTFGTPNNAIHCTLETSAHDKKTCLDGVQYLITIPGILPRFIKS